MAEEVQVESQTELVLAAPTNSVRLAFWKIAVNPKFDFVILLSIAINCFFMAIEVFYIIYLMYPKTCVILSHLKTLLLLYKNTFNYDAPS